MLAAGLDGIRNGMSLPEEVGKNVFEMSSRERRDHGIRRLPETLSHALDELEQSELMNQALGDHVFDWFLRNKRKEWDAYQHHVSRFELERYLPIL